MPTLPDKLLIRGSEARSFTGLSEDEWAKVVSARVIEPIYLVWQVVNGAGRVLFAGAQEKAEAWQRQHGGKLKPAGWPYYRTADVRKLGTTETANPTR